jgi:integrase
MGIRNSAGKWQYRFRVKGQDVCVTTGLDATERNRKKALELESAHRQGVMEGRWGLMPLTPRAFSDCVPVFVSWCKIEYGQKAETWRRIQTSMASCSVFFGKQMISMIHPGEVEAYKTWRLTPREELVDGKKVTIEPVRPVTVKHDLDNLSVFFKWAVKANYARLNPVKEVKRPSDIESRRERILTPAEEKLYFANAKGTLAKVAKLILLQGMRPEEVYRIRKEDVDFETSTLRIRFGKTKTARRTLKLTQESTVILGRQMSSHGPWIFPSPKRPGAHITKLKCPHDRVCETTGVQFVLYDLRHTFATRMVEAGIDIMALKEILGHSDIRVTMRYVHPSQSRQDAAMAIYDKLNEERRAKEPIQ